MNIAIAIIIQGPTGKRRMPTSGSITSLKSPRTAIVTEANLDYDGSITIDEGLMREANIVEGERVQVVNLNNGERLETYVIKGKLGSGIIGMNGPAALKCKEGDRIHIISYGIVDSKEKIKGKVVRLGEDNKVI